MQELRTGMFRNNQCKSTRSGSSVSRMVVLQATGDRPTDEDALEMIAEADLDGDGRSLCSIDHWTAMFDVRCLLVNYDEFVLIMSSHLSSRK